MEFKDYYQILGVAPDASDEQIKKTYRKLARQYHPDVNPGNKEAEEKFKTINEAYQALSNPEARKKYDQLRAQYQAYQQRGGRPEGFNWQDWQARPEQGQDYTNVSPEDFQDMFGGESPFSDFFNSIFGQGAPVSGRQQARAGRAARARAGRDIEMEVEVSLEEAYRGTTRVLQMEGQRIEARIPTGVRTGSRVRLAGQGEPGRNGGTPGNLYLVIAVMPDPRFERQGDDLYTTIPVDIYTAVLGGEVRVPTLDKAVMLRIPANTQADRTFRLRGKGMPKLSNPQVFGDLLARVKLVLPENMSQQEIDTIRQMAASRQHA